MGEIKPVADGPLNLHDLERDITGRSAVSANKDSLNPRRPWRLIAVGSWLTLSVSLAVWWLIFGLRQVEALGSLRASIGAVAIADEVERQHRMLMYEGATLILSLLVGGGALLYYMANEIRRARHLQVFFASFTHDLKTSLASLRLQAESLEEDLRESGHSRLARRLVKDTVRLELQLENSLLLAAPNSENRLLIEPIALAPILESMRYLWPDLTVVIEGEGTVAADSRAIESVFKNLLQNSVVHGRASKVSVEIVREGDWVRADLKDDGKGFSSHGAKPGAKRGLRDGFSCGFRDESRDGIGHRIKHAIGRGIRPGIKNGTGDASKSASENLSEDLNQKLNQKLNQNRFGNGSGEPDESAASSLAGMPRGNFEDLGKMFKRHSSTSGSGLGLYLANRLIRSMNGVLQVLEVSKGFGVRIILPASEPGASLGGEERR